MSVCLVADRKVHTDIDGEPDDFSADTHAVRWDASDQSLLSATLMATPTQRITWLEEALQLAYAIGALKPRRFISKEEWDAMGSSLG
ncbi:hypothetical protein YTPLAS72_31390 [Nitrospira sp.]|nr:hypothetical protein YTPLAS72_31390 [Nitrospira sp.]